MSRKRTYYLINYKTPGGERCSRVYAPGPKSAEQHVLRTRRDVVEVLHVREEQAA